MDRGRKSVLFFFAGKTRMQIGCRGDPSLAFAPEFRIPLLLFSILFPVLHEAGMIRFSPKRFRDIRGKLAV
jgi:hypothetical protein